MFTDRVVLEDVIHAMSPDRHLAKVPDVALNIVTILLPQKVILWKRRVKQIKFFM